MPEVLDRLFLHAARRNNLQPVPPVWMMRQAGRYHNHYQKLKSKYSFDELCRTPELAAETAMGPIIDFDFDAAILFSDILYPLNAIGIETSFNPAPVLSFLLRSKEDFKKLNPPDLSIKPLAFQAQAVAALRKRLDDRKSLIGFCGAPWTLFVFACCGSHKADLSPATNALYNGGFDQFCEYIEPLLVQTLCDQLEHGADTVALFDTAAGDMPSDAVASYLIPSIERVMSAIKRRFPNAPIIYYPKNAGPKFWSLLGSLPFDVLGVDHHNDIAFALKEYSKQWAIQGNFDPNHFLLSEHEYLSKLSGFFEAMQKLSPTLRQSWICGLGHGVLPSTPEYRVKQFIERARRLRYE